MPAGDLLTDDYQLELRGVLMGYGTDYQIRPEGIGGLGSAPAKVRQVSLAHGDGSVAADDLLGERIITVPITITGDDPGDAMDKLDALNTAWAPGAAVVLHGQLPGWAHWSVTGHPRPAAADLSNLKSGIIETLYEFHALEPTITTGL